MRRGQKKKDFCSGSTRLTHKASSREVEHLYRVDDDGLQNSGGIEANVVCYIGTVAHVTRKPSKTDLIFPKTYIEDQQNAYFSTTTPPSHPCPNNKQTNTFTLPAGPAKTITLLPSTLYTLVSLTILQDRIAHLIIHPVIPMLNPQAQTLQSHHPHPQPRRQHGHY